MGLKEVNYKDAREIEFLEKLVPYQREKGLWLNIKVNNCEIRI